MTNEWARRPMWASPEHEARWAPVLRAWSEAWPRVERRSVGRVRPGALQAVAPDALPALSREAAEQGLEVTVVDVAQMSSAPYAAGSVPGRPGLRVAIHEPGRARVWLTAWGDDAAVGELLGFPSCCRQFFARTWGRSKRDPTGAMVEGAGSPEGNPLLRWTGVRLVPHLPCSFGCKPSAELGKAMADIARAAGLDELVDDVLTLLGTPMCWSALHGAGEVVLPGVMKVAFSTDYTPTLRSIERRGTALPAPPPLPPSDPPTWEDNGFRSEAAMLAAHGPVLGMVGRAIAPWQPRTRPPAVVDLGCGDGRLLAEIVRRWPEATCVGVECDPGRARRGQRRHPEVRILPARIEDVVPRLAGFDVALLQPRRLLEMPADAAAVVRACLPQLADQLVVYSYDREPPFDHLLAEAKLESTGTRVVTAAAVATLAVRRRLHEPCLCCRDPYCEGLHHHHDAALAWEPAQEAGR